MALTDRHLLALGALACAAIVAAFLPPEPPQRMPGWQSVFAPRLMDAPPAARRHARLQDHLGRARDELTLLARRDSLLALARREPGAGAPGTLAVLLDPRLPARTRAALERAARAEWGPPRAAGTPAIYAVVLDTAPDSLPRLSRLGAQVLAPSAADGRHCLVVAAVGHEFLDPLPDGAELPPRLALVAQPASGACRFYGAFGAPGAGIERWLAGRRWDVAAGGSLARPHPHHAPPRRERGRGTFWSYDDLRWVVSMRGLRCLRGDAEACAATLFDPPDRDGWRTWRGPPPRAGVSRVPPARWPRDWERAEHALLADMAAALGPERFAAFWRSPLPPAEAFRAAAGEPVGAWVMRWGRARFGTPAPEGFEARGALLSLGLALAAAAAGLAWSARREAAR